MNDTDKSYSSANHLLIFLLFIVLLRFFTMGLYPLTDSSEARYAEVARKMVELNDWITLWYEYGVPFWAKPPLSTWLTAASMKMFGINEFSARLPHFIIAIIIARMVWNVAIIHSRRQSVLAIAILSGTFLYIVASAAVLTDMSMSLTTTMVMTGFWSAIQKNEKGLSRDQLKLFAGLGLGMLAKGPVAVVLSTMPIFLWMVLSGNIILTIKKIQWFKGAIIFLAVTLPWYVAAEIRTPGFIHYFFYGEHWQRFTVTGWAGDRYGSAHAEAHGYIWIVGLAAFLPWTLILPLTLIGRKTEKVSDHKSIPSQKLKSETISSCTEMSQPTLTTVVGRFQFPSVISEKMPLIYLFSWLLTPFVFFTFAGNILWTYVLPSIPALALISSRWLDRDVRKKGIELLMILVLAAMALMISGFLYKQEFNHSWKTAKFVVKEYEKININGLPLVFLGDRPYSGYFYSAGKVLHVDDFKDLDEKLVRGKFYLALTHEQSLVMPTSISSNLITQLHVDAYDLYLSKE